MEFDSTSLTRTFVSKHDVIFKVRYPHQNKNYFPCSFSRAPFFPLWLVSPGGKKGSRRWARSVRSSVHWVCMYSPSDPSRTPQRHEQKQQYRPITTLWSKAHRIDRSSIFTEDMAPHTHAQMASLNKYHSIKTPRHNSKLSTHFPPCVYPLLPPLLHFLSSLLHSLGAGSVELHRTSPMLPMYQV